MVEVILSLSKLKKKTFEYLHQTFETPNLTHLIIQTLDVSKLSFQDELIVDLCPTPFENMRDYLVLGNCYNFKYKSYRMCVCLCVAKKIPAPKNFFLKVKLRTAVKWINFLPLTSKVLKRRSRLLHISRIKENKSGGSKSLQNIR